MAPPGASERVAAPHPPPPPPKSPQPRFPVAVLSFFDGIGTALHALKTWSTRPVLSWSWELDPEAVKVASSQHPEMIHHGDVFGRKPAEVLSAVTASVPRDTVLLVFAAPPCHDFFTHQRPTPRHTGHGRGEVHEVRVVASGVHLFVPLSSSFLARKRCDATFVSARARRGTGMQSVRLRCI